MVSKSEINLLFENYGIKSIVSFKQDNINKKYNKLCMVKIVDQELLVASIGIDNYFKHLKKAVFDVRLFLDTCDNKQTLSSYIIDGGNFIIVSNDDISNNDFINLMKKLYDNFRFTQDDADQVPILARFAVVVENDDLIKCAFSELNDIDKLHLDWVVSNKLNVMDIDKEVKMINIIKWAIDNAGVMAYYQGIYDVENGCINRYEALMRIKDVDGNIYCPISFLNIAKKYHMYHELSAMMIKQVLRDITNYKISSSINLSANDINNSVFKIWFFELLDKYNFKNKLAIEIVEDESFDNAILCDFIANIKAKGIKIAIDDFGSAYSNMLKIIQLEPDYIKIDGSIIKDLNNFKVNQSAFETIMFLANKIGAKTVGEFVENIDLAQLLKEYGVDLLQGYHYAKPLPIEAIINSLDQI